MKAARLDDIPHDLLKISRHNVDLVRRTGHDLSSQPEILIVAAQAEACSLIARGVPGSIVCTASVDRSCSAPFHTSFGAGKGGLADLVKSMAVAWGRHGIRANVVAPSAIIKPRIPHRSDAEPAITGRIPLNRRSTVEEIADAIVLLLSNMSRYIAGQTLEVDGGFRARYPFDLSPPTSTTGGG